jgi:release factor glutamine methyltransferase
LHAANVLQMNGNEAHKRFVEAAQAGGHDEREARAIWQSWLQDRWGLTRTQWMLHEHEPVSDAFAAQWEWDAQQLRVGIPYQYTLGWVNFAGVRLDLGPGVLIPRPETEAWVLDWSKRLPNAERALDVCSGSGCIATGLAHALPKATVYAVEWDAEAWPWLIKNAAQFPGVHPVSADALAPPPPALTSLDLLLSNPPYIPEGERETLASHVRDYEPGAALFVPQSDPLVFYRSLVAWGERLLRPGGWWSAECHTDFTSEVAQLLSRPGWSVPEISADIFGKPRFVEAQWLGIFTP